MTDEIQEQTVTAEEPVVGEGVATAEAAALTEPQVAKLVLKRGGVLTSVEYTIHPPATIGRFDPAVGPIDVDLATEPEGAYISRRHAKIVKADGAWKIVDLGSSNGTFILRDDFERVEEAELANGTEFALGNARFVFQLF